MKKHLVIVSLALASYSVAACGKKNDSDKGSQSESSTAKLSPAQLAKPPVLPPLSKEASAEYASASAGSSKSAPLALFGDKANVIEQCADTALGNMLINTTADSILLNGSTDLLECLKKGFAGPNGVIVNSGTLRFYSLTQCVGNTTSLTSLNGKKYIQYDGTYGVSCPGTVRYMRNYYLKISLISRYTGEEVEGNFEVVSAQSSPENEPCEWTIENGIRTEDNCVVIDKYLNNVDSNDNFYSRMLSHKLKWNNNKPGKYYESGTLDYSANDWTGTYTYSAAGTPPTFNASNGTESLSTEDLGK